MPQLSFDLQFDEQSRRGYRVSNADTAARESCKNGLVRVSLGAAAGFGAALVAISVVTKRRGSVLPD